MGKKKRAQQRAIIRKEQGQIQGGAPSATPELRNALMTAIDNGHGKDLAGAAGIQKLTQLHRLASGADPMKPHVAAILTDHLEKLER